MAAGRGRIDVHPLVLDDQGNGVQAGLHGGRHLYPAAAFVTGSIEGRAVGCLSAAQQIGWHTGYPLRDTDHAGLEVLSRLTSAFTDDERQGGVSR